jgi:hypothetical protein
MSNTLKDQMPFEFMRDEYKDASARKYADIKVLSVHENRWPGRHRNVFHWVTLENGKRVGWNENPARGWSFPVI